jgi:cytidine deaminase
VAVFNAIASGQKRIVRVAVSCPEGNKSNPGMLMPCGACRQVIAEFASHDVEILVEGLGVFTLKELLPHPFQLESF